MAYVCCIKTNILRSTLKHFLILKSSNFLLSSKEIKIAHGFLKVMWALGQFSLLSNMLQINSTFYPSLWNHLILLDIKDVESTEDVNVGCICLIY